MLRDSCRVLGGIPSRFPDLATARKVNIDFPLAGSQAFISALTPLPKRQKFNFVYCSGRAARRDLEKKYWFFNDARKIKVFIPPLFHSPLLSPSKNMTDGIFNREKSRTS
jgi:hypothetical protein